MISVGLGLFLRRRRCWGAIDGEFLDGSRTWLADFIIGSCRVGVGGDVGGEGLEETGVGCEFLIGRLTTYISIVATWGFTFEAINVGNLFGKEVNKFVKAVAGTKDIGGGTYEI